MQNLLLGTLPLGQAMLLRKLKVSGSRSRALSLEPLLHACQTATPGSPTDACEGVPLGR